MNPIIDNTNQVDNIIGSTDMTTYNGSVYEAEWYLELEMWKFWQQNPTVITIAKNAPKFLRTGMNLITFKYK